MLEKNIGKAQIQFIRSLQQPAARKEQGLFVVEGTKMVSEVCRASLSIHSLYGEEKWYQTAFPQITFGSPRRPDTYVVSTEVLSRISTLKAPNQVLALVEIPSDHFKIKDLESQLSIFLDTVQDPGNLGTILRIADWFGIDHLVCSTHTVDCYNPKVVQSSMGAILRVKVHYGDLKSYLQEARTLEIPVYGTFLQGTNLYQTPLTPHGILLMGNESKGIQPELAEYVSSKLWIPCYPLGTPRSESLNVAMATALCCGEFRRRILPDTPQL